MPKHYKYQMVFMPYTKMRKRIDSIRAGEGDPFPGTSGHEVVEGMLSALAEGKPNPYAMVNGIGQKRRTPRKAKDYPIVERVAEALIELF